MLSETEREDCVERIGRLPAQLRELVSGLTDEQLTTRYLPHEWTVAQNVHHLADSHVNSFIRLKLILTEENPTIRPYDQDAWANLPKSNNPEIKGSLLFLEKLHKRWVKLYKSWSEEQWQRPGVHPESGTINPQSLVKDYAEHGEGHLDQIQRTLAAA